MDRRSILEKFNGVHRYEYLRWNSETNFRELADIGVFVPYADSFSYQGSAFLLIGFHGKTSTTGRFVRWNNRKSKRLGRDAVTLEYDEDQLYAHNDDNQLRQQGLVANLQPVIERAEGFPLEAIFFLESTRSVGFDLNSALSQMFGYENPQTITPEVEGLRDDYRHVFGAIPIVKLPREKSADERYHTLKRLVNELLPH